MLQTLDNIIRWLGFLELDQNDPKLSRFGHYQVPTAPTQPRGIEAPHNTVHGAARAFSALDSAGGVGGAMTDSDVMRPGFQKPPDIGEAAGGRCSCALFKISTTDPRSAKLTPLCLATPGWNSSWSPTEVRYEEQRRLVWCALMLATGFVSYSHLLGQPPLDLAITKPWMFKVLFPGETLFRGSNPRSTHDVLSGDRSPKDSMWALYARSRLLYASAMHVKFSNHLSEQAKAEFAVRAWLETERVEAQLDMHTCDIERTTGGYHIYFREHLEGVRSVIDRRSISLPLCTVYLGREYLFNTQSLVSSQLTTRIPHPYLYVLNCTWLLHVINSSGAI